MQHSYWFYPWNLPRSLLRGKFTDPDVYLGFVALFHPRRALKAAVIMVGGALVGGTLMFLLGGLNGAGMEVWRELQAAALEG